MDMTLSGHEDWQHWNFRRGAKMVNNYVAGFLIGFLEHLWVIL